MQFILTAEQSAAIDRYTIDSIGIPSLILMEHAALGAADAIIEHYSLTTNDSRTVVVLCGPGNNGGDGFALARILHARGYNTLIASLPDALGIELSGDAKFNSELCRRIKVKRIETDSELSELFYDEAYYSDDALLNELISSSHEIIWVDAIFGVGLTRPPEGLFTKAIKFLDRQRHVVALDIPSGINATTGAVVGCAPHTELTLTFGFAKRGHFTDPGRGYCGKLKVIDIGIPKNILSKFFYSDTPVKQKETVAVSDRYYPSITPDPPDLHKGSAGRIAMIAGSDTMFGAALIATQAAFRSGAGLLTLFSTPRLQTALAISAPQATFCDIRSLLDNEPEEKLARTDAIAIGPGIGLAPENVTLIEKLIPLEIPLVIDADALNLIAQHKIEITRPDNNEFPIILTPHPLEAARLLEKSLDEILADPFETTRKLSDRFNASVVFKTSTPIVVTPESLNTDIFISSYGNPGMATGGMGDLLTGIIAARITRVAFWENPFIFYTVHGALQENLCGAVVAHGLAGDIAAQEKGTLALGVNDLLNALPQAWQELLSRNN